MLDSCRFIINKMHSSDIIACFPLEYVNKSDYNSNLINVTGQINHMPI